MRNATSPTTCTVSRRRSNERLPAPGDASGTVVRVFFYIKVVLFKEEMVEVRYREGLLNYFGGMSNHVVERILHKLHSSISGAPSVDGATREWRAAGS